MADMTTIRAEGGDMDVYLGVPTAPARGPAIVLMFHRGGIDKFTRMVVDRLVGLGYRVAVPDVHHRAPGAMPIADRKDLLRDSQVVADVRATVDFLRARPDVDTGRIIVMGHCMGGRMALLAAGSLPVFHAAIVYYGGGVARSWGEEGFTPFDRLRNIRCPVIGFFGEQDKNPSPKDVAEIAAELLRHGVKHDFHHYAGVGHGFQNPAHDTPPERAAAEDAWRRTAAFLHEVAPA